MPYPQPVKTNGARNPNNLNEFTSCPLGSIPTLELPAMAKS